MDLRERILLGLAAAFFLLALVRLLRTPLRLAGRLLLNTALGLGALWAVHTTSAVTGITLGVNLWNALTVAILGLPGFVLLLLTQWVL